MIIKLLTQAALQTGKVHRHYFCNKKLTRQHKTSHQNLVTQADFESEKVIYDTIVKNAPHAGLNPAEIGFISEETIRHSGKHLFVADPLDGTNNFASGLPIFCVIIAYFHRKKLSAGVVYFPLIDTLYSAEEDLPAYKTTNASKTKNKQKKSVLKIHHQPLADCLVAISISSNQSLHQQQFSRIKKLHPLVRGVRDSGCAGFDYMQLCDNAFGVVVENRNYIWDLAAPMFIIKQAGGIACDLTGKEIQLNTDNPEQTYPVIACHPKNKFIFTPSLLKPTPE